MTKGMKKGVKSHDLQSIFNMSQLTMDKIHELQKEADRYSIECSSLQFRFLTFYYTTLKSIYRYIRPIMNKNIQKSYDDRFQDIQNKLYRLIKFNWDTYLTIEEMHRDLIQEMQHRNLLWSATRTEKYAENYLKEEYRL